MNLFDRVKSAFAPDAAKAQVSQPVYDDGGNRTAGSNGLKAWNFVEPRKNAKQLRLFADNNEFVRTAINRRKRQIGMAKWRLVRRDNPNAQPDPRIEKRVRDLLDLVNPRGESFRSLLDQVVEDVLVLDAGCIEKEKTLGGELLYLHAVNGATIAPDREWDGTSPRAVRYRQYDQGKCVAQFRNDQLVYIMANPSTHRVVGWSPLETLFRVVRAELFGEEYDYDMMRTAAPNVLLYLGPGVTDQQREKYAEYWNAEIAGQNAIAFANNANPEAKGGPAAIKLRDDSFEERLAYKKWLAGKIAAVFEMDLTVFNLTEAVQKSIGNTLTARTDEGANGVASLFSEFLTREIIWEIDPSRNHAFEFDDLNQRDALAQAKIDQIYMGIGKTFPNELRARDGQEPVEWGEEPYSASQSQFAGDPPPDGAGEGDTPNDSSQNPDESSEQQGAAKSAVPFAAASRTRTAGLRYLGG